MEEKAEMSGEDVLECIRGQKHRKLEVKGRIRRKGEYVMLALCKQLK